MESFEIDAYAPAQMAARVEKAGIIKGNLDVISTFTLAVLAGSFIAFGAVLYTYVIHDSQLSIGLTKLIGGLVFCLGLILVIIAGAELFTGNNLIVMAYVSRKVTLEQLLRNWIIVFIGNLVGSLAIVFLIWLSRQWTSADSAVGVKALMIANSKVNLAFWEAFSKRILCNILVCLAVWLCFSGRSVTDKILAIIFPITAFVALGFEHSVANMYFIPAGLLIKQSPQVLEAAQNALGQAPDLSKLTIPGFLLHNLLPVSIGNIIGGGFMVAAIYWFVYLRRSAAEPIRRLMTDGPPTVAPGASVAEAVQVMKEHAIGSVLVGQPGKAVGIVSEADIVRKVISANQSPASMKVEQIMSTPLVSVDVKTSVYDIYRTMADNRIRHLVITDQGQWVGFVSVKDLLRRPII
ncbi:MAG TPA: formate/nitrite family transporter [Sedimentisphaerales bacterium]|nr:formate/nitrite family transporter [Sedimentisphaerales bacterium]